MRYNWLSTIFNRNGVRRNLRSGLHRHVDAAGRLVELLEDRAYLSPALGYALSLGAAGTDSVNAIVADSSGNTYVTGVFSGTVNFDPIGNASGATLSAINGNDTFLAKYSASGTFQWARDVANTVTSVSATGGGNALALDSTGNVYLAWQNNITAFNSSGTGVFQDTFGSADSCTVTGISIGSGGLVATGNFDAPTNFNPTGNNTLQNKLSDTFIVSLGTNNTFSWVAQIGGTGSTNMATAITQDSNGSVYATGYFSKTTDLDPNNPPTIPPGTTLATTLTSSGLDDIYIAKFDRLGDPLKFVSVGSTGIDRPHAITVDSTDNVYLGGEYQGIVNFNPDLTGNAQNLGTNTAGQEAFLVKLDNTVSFVWGKTTQLVSATGGGFNGNNPTTTNGIAVDSSGNVFATGAFSGQRNIDATGTNQILTATAGSSVTNTDVFVEEWTSAGALLQGFNFGSATANQSSAGLGIAVNGGNLYDAGSFTGTVNFNPGVGAPVTRTAAGGNSNGFVTAYVSPGITVSPTSGLQTSMLGAIGGTASFSVVLNTPPSDDVTIPLSLSNPAEATLSTTSLTFTTANFNVPQTVTLTGLNDTTATADVPYTVITGPSVSNDSGYNGIDAADVSVTNVNNAGAAVLIDPSDNIVVPEGGTTAVNVTLHQLPTAAVTVTITSSDPNNLGIAPATLTFTPSNYNIPQTVTLIGADDKIVGGPTAFQFTLTTTSTDIAYNTLTPRVVDVTRTETDQAGVTVTPTTSVLTSDQGASATFTIALTSIPTDTVTIPMAITGDAGTAAPATLSTSSITFDATNWNVPQTVTVTGISDTAFTGDLPYTIVLSPSISIDTHYNGLQLPTISGNNLDTQAVRVYRAYDANADYHFFTTSNFEYNAAVAAGWQAEANAAGFVLSNTPGAGLTPLFRLYSPPDIISRATKRGNQNHYYTADVGERNILVSLGWTFEKSEGYIYPFQAPGTEQIFRLYNVLTGDHIYTQDGNMVQGILNAFPGIWEQNANLGWSFPSNSFDPITDFAGIAPTLVPATSSAELAAMNSLGTPAAEMSASPGAVASNPSPATIAVAPTSGTAATLSTGGSSDSATVNSATQGTADTTLDSAALDQLWANASQQIGNAGATGSSLLDLLS